MNRRIGIWCWLRLNSWLWHWCNWLLVGLLILVCLLRLRLWLGHRLWLHGWLWLWCWLRCGRLLGHWLVVHRLLVLGYYRSVHLPYTHVICGWIIAEEGYCVNYLMIYIPHRGILHPTNFLAEGVDLLVELGEAVAVGDEVVGNGDGAALLDIFNLRPIAGDCFLRSKGPLGSLGEATVTELFGRNDGRHNELTWEVVGEILVFRPRVEAVKEDVALPSGGKALHLLGSGTDDDVFASLFAPGFAKFGLRLRGDGDAAAAHFVVEDTAGIDLGDAKACHMVDRLALACA